MQYEVLPRENQSSSSRVHQFPDPVFVALRTRRPFSPFSMGRFRAGNPWSLFAGGDLLLGFRLTTLKG
jgi:hypothetical protein